MNKTLSHSVEDSVTKEFWEISSKLRALKITLNSIKRRQRYQAKGKDIFKTMSVELRPLFAAGCMLYWGEGAKSKNGLCFTNADEKIHVLFIDFLSKCLAISKDRYILRIQTHSDSIFSKEAVQQHWISALGLPKTVTVYVDYVPSKITKRPLKFGTCALMLRNSNEILHYIYGGIQEVAGFLTDEWLFKPENFDSDYTVLSQRKNELAQKRKYTISKTVNITKELLETLVWLKPSTKLAIELGVSDTLIRKWCKAYGIRKPPPGYWTKFHNN